MGCIIKASPPVNILTAAGLQFCSIPSYHTEARASLPYPSYAELKTAKSTLNRFCKEILTCNNEDQRLKDCGEGKLRGIDTVPVQDKSESCVNSLIMTSLLL